MLSRPSYKAGAVHRGRLRGTPAIGADRDVTDAEIRGQGAPTPGPFASPAFIVVFSAIVRINLLIATHSSAASRRLDVGLTFVALLQCRVGRGRFRVDLRQRM